MFWLGFIAALAVALVYVFIVRPLLKEQPILSEAFKAEASFVDKVRAKITGWRTRIVSRAILIAGVLVEFYDQVTPLVMGQDWTPITEKIPSWTMPIGMLAVSLLIMKLKTMTKNAPQVVTQKDASAPAQVVAVIPPVKT